MCLHRRDLYFRLYSAQVEGQSGVLIKIIAVVRYIPPRFARTWRDLVSGKQSTKLGGMVRAGTSHFIGMRTDKAASRLADAGRTGASRRPRGVAYPENRFSPVAKCAR